LDTSESRLDQLEARNRQLEERVRQVEDVQEIIALFSRWHYACSGGFDGLQAGRMEALECLTEDGTIEAKGIHEAGKGPTGRDQYTEYWEYYYGDAGPLPYVFQTNLGDRVEVDGDTAIHYNDMLCIVQPRGMAKSVYGGSATESEAAQGVEGLVDLDDPMLMITHRVNYVVRTPDGWRIKKTTVDGGFRTSLQDLIGVPTKNELPSLEKRIPWSHPQ
jgi:hypothetical protein